MQYSQANPQESARKLADKFHCGKTQIQSILLKKEEILKAFEANSSSNTKRSRGARNEEIDNRLLDWFRKARSKNMPQYYWAHVTRKGHANCSGFSHLTRRI